MKSKKYAYSYEEIYEVEESGNAEALAEEVLSDEALKDLKEIIIGCWGESYENNIQPLLDKFAEENAALQHIESLFVGDMEFEECEVSWIEQGNYENLLRALPNLKKLTIKGSVNLSLGKVRHENLEELEIICGGLPSTVIRQIAQAHLPKLKKLNLYIGVEDYGFDGDISVIRELLHAPLISRLEYLGLGDSEIQDEIVEEFLKLGTLHRLKTLDFSNGTLTDVGGQMLLDHESLLQNLEKLDLTYHFLSDEMMEKLEQSKIPAVLDDPQEADEYDEEVYYYPMLTE